MSARLTIISWQPFTKSWERLFFILLNFTNAHAHYVRAYQITLNFPEFDLTAARIAYHLGLACRQLHHKDAIQFLLSAENFFKNTSDMPKLAHTLFEIGIAFADSRNYVQAEAYLEQALAIYTSLEVLESARRVRQTYSLEILSVRNPSLAVEQLLINVSEYEKINDKVRLSLSYATIAYAYLNQGNSYEAEKYLSYARNQFSEEEADKHPQYAFVYKIFAMYLLHIKDYQKSIQYSLESTEIFDKMGLEWEASESLELSVSAYRSLGMFEQALDVSERVNRLLRRSKEQQLI